MRTQSCRDCGGNLYQPDWREGRAMIEGRADVSKAIACLSDHGKPPPRGMVVEHVNANDYPEALRLSVAHMRKYGG